MIFKTKNRILKELQEKRALPMGVKEFEEWSMRIIDQALIPGATIKSQQFALADELMHVAPGVAFESDGYFVNRLRKFAVNQIAHAMREEIRNEEKARLAEKEKTNKTPTNENKILANNPV